jgi:hypothetical protein
MRLALTADGFPEYDLSGRVRVDCGDYEDWYHRDDLNHVLLQQLCALEAQSGATPPTAPLEAVTGSPAQTTGPSVTARELAAALHETPAVNGRTSGRPVTPEEAEARLQQERAKAEKMQLEADLVRLRVERERQALRDADRKRRREEAERPAPSAQTPGRDDPVAAAVAAQRIAEAQLATLRAQAEHGLIASQVQQQTEQEVAGNPLAPAGWGCLSFFVFWGVALGLMLAIGENGYVLGPLALPLCIVGTVLVVRWVQRRRKAAIAEAWAYQERREAYERQTAEVRSQPRSE